MTGVIRRIPDELKRPKNGIQLVHKKVGAVHLCTKCLSKQRLLGQCVVQQSAQPETARLALCVTHPPIPLCVYVCHVVHASMRGDKPLSRDERPPLRKVCGV